MQYYTLGLIFMVARQNKQRVRDTFCKQFAYLFVFIGSNILIVLQSLLVGDLLENNPDSNSAMNKLFISLAINGALMQPLFLKQLHAVAKKNEKVRQNQSNLE